MAARYQLSMQNTVERLAYYFHQLGVDYIFDITLARHICLIESAREFVANRKQEPNENSKWNPILSSTCPGFVCYAEKSQGPTLVPLLSKVKSPQQIMGLLVKKRLKHNGTRVKANQVYHITLMPCYDKKLEASRKENTLNNSNIESISEVDCVITPIEVEKIFEINQIDFVTLPCRKLDQLILDPNLDYKLQSHPGSGSGGYAENLFQLVAVEMFNQNNSIEQLTWNIVRNLDFLEINLFDDGTVGKQEPNRKPLLSLAILNGFRNIQNLVSRLKRRTWNYDYVEVSACPKGCLNGGAQLRNVPYSPLVNTSPDIDPVAIAFEQVQALYIRLPSMHPISITEPVPITQLTSTDICLIKDQNQRLYAQLEIDQEFVNEFYTKFTALEKTFSILNSNW